MSAQDGLHWLPEALEPVAFRLARADECAFKIGDLISKWSVDGPLDFEQVRDGDTVQMVLTSLRPIPPEASLLFSEAVNHLRATVDNVIWYLVELEDANLPASVAALVNMPITESQEKLDSWSKRRNKISAFAKESKLGRRMHMLQPFVDTRSSVPSMGGLLADITGQEVESPHPLLLLQAYSNADKHRSIQLAAARIFSSTTARPLSEQDLAHRAIEVGDAMGPPTTWGQVSFVDTNAAAMVRRPAPFSAWANPVKEINGIRQHISKVVIPILLTGLELTEALPPGIEVGDNGISSRDRILSGTRDDAEERLRPILRARYAEAENKQTQVPPVVDK